MFKILTPVQFFHRKTVTLAVGIAAGTIKEGEWLEPSKVAGEEDMYRPVGATVPVVAGPCWLSNDRPDSFSSNFQGSGTTVIPFGPKIEAVTDMFERDNTKFPAGITAYAPQMPLTVKNRVLLPAGVNETIFAVAIVPPASLAAGTTMKVQTV